MVFVGGATRPLPRDWAKEEIRRDLSQSCHIARVEPEVEKEKKKKKTSSSVFKCRTLKKADDAR